MSSTALVQSPNAGAAVASFDMRAYLATTSSKQALEVQQQLAGAYDEACRALIGPNDVQKEGNREFKKKSAWRKLGRHFRISTTVVGVERQVLEGEFLAVVTVRATAPWGQSLEAVRACCTDEATGRRVITVADAIATAETRATNRGISNLIAMGEVSAEEIGERTERSERAPRGAAAEKKKAPLSEMTVEQAKALPMPFQKGKPIHGKPLGEIKSDFLTSLAGWIAEKQSENGDDWHADTLHAIRLVLKDREKDQTKLELDAPAPAATGGPVPAPGAVADALTPKATEDERPSALADEDDDLPF